MKKKKTKIYIKPSMQGNKLVSFDMKSNVDIYGFQFRLNGFSNNHFYQFVDIGNVKKSIKATRKNNKRKDSIVDVYDFNVLVNNSEGLIIGFTTNGKKIKSGHTHLFSLSVKTNMDGMKLDKCCIKELIISDKYGKDLKYKGTNYRGGCINIKSNEEIREESNEIAKQIA